MPAALCLTIQVQVSPTVYFSHAKVKNISTAFLINFSVECFVYRKMGYRGKCVISLLSPASFPNVPQIHGTLKSGGEFGLWLFRD